jgi:hypothetical protein
MNDQTLINALFSTCGALGGWWLKTMWASIIKLQTEQAVISARLADSAIMIANDYVKKEELDRLIDAIFKKLDRIEDKLDNKVDK